MLFLGCVTLNRVKSPSTSAPATRPCRLYRCALMRSCSPGAPLPPALSTLHCCPAAVSADDAGGLSCVVASDRSVFMNSSVPSHLYSVYVRRQRSTTNLSKSFVYREDDTAIVIRATFSIVLGLRPANANALKHQCKHARVKALD